MRYFQCHRKRRFKKTVFKSKNLILTRLKFKQIFRVIHLEEPIYAKITDLDAAGSKIGLWVMYQQVSKQQNKEKRFSWEKLIILFIKKVKLTLTYFSGSNFSDLQVFQPSLNHPVFASGKEFCIIYNLFTLCILFTLSTYIPVSGHFQEQPPEVFYKKGVHKNFAIFTGKHLCWSLFLIKLQT